MQHLGRKQQQDTGEDAFEGGYGQAVGETRTPGRREHAAQDQHRQGRQIDEAQAALRQMGRIVAAERGRRGKITWVAA